jgi:PAS domain S-box-containing protein
MNISLQTLKAITILYVEDDEMMRAQTVKMFQNLFKEVYVAFNGKEALDIFKDKISEIDTIVSDINMPVMDGLEMTKAVRVINKDIPIIITTAYSDQENTMNALNLGVSRYITKPLKIGELSEIIVELSQKYRKHENITKMTQQLVRNHKAIQEHTNELQDDYEHIKNKLEMKSFLIDNYLFYIKTDSFAVITDITSRIETFFGYSKDELMGQEIKILQADDSNFSSLQKTLLEATKLKKEVHNIFTMQTKSGKRFDFTTTVVPKFREDQIVRGYKFYLNINP